MFTDRIQGVPVCHVSGTHYTALPPNSSSIYTEVFFCLRWKQFRVKPATYKLLPKAKSSWNCTSIFPTRFYAMTLVTVRDKIFISFIVFLCSSAEGQLPSGRRFFYATSALGCSSAVHNSETWNCKTCVCLMLNFRSHITIIRLPFTFLLHVA